MAFVPVMGDVDALCDPHAVMGLHVIDEAFEGSGDTPIVLAVSLEPKGGSPTGHPTGPVVARGRFSAV